jgi:nitrate reductase delta subunit
MTDWKLLSLLLQYPDDELLGLGPALPGWMRATPLPELQALYVRTFDFDRRAALHLTYHSHGDRRQRGLELVRLKRRYADAGLPMTGDELPDYLPVLLEFAALSPAEGERLLAEFRTAIELVRSRLHQTGNPYADLLDAVAAALPRPTRAQIALARKIAEEGPPTELVGLEPFAAEVAS